MSILEELAKIKEEPAKASKPSKTKMVVLCIHRKSGDYLFIGGRHRKVCQKKEDFWKDWSLKEHHIFHHFFQLIDREEQLAV